MDIEEIKETIKRNKLKHIAIIMDGNRRWAKTKNMPAAVGHKKGVEALRNITKACKKFGIEYLTVYAFSTENWNRTNEEVSFLMELLAKTIKSEVPIFKENDIRLTFIGKRDNLNEGVVKVIEYGENETKNCSSLNLQIAFNYGARMEITEAVKKIGRSILNGETSIENITEETVSNNLYTANMPDPDLLIRTGGEKRISNYLLWQCAYSEIYITEQYWPDFNEDSLFEAIDNFDKRERRFGK